MTSTAHPTTPRVNPLKQLGPDVIHMLRCISKQHTGDRYTYDAARVQRTRFGGPSTEINFGELEMLEQGHPDSYGILISRRAMPEALKWHERLTNTDPSLIQHELGILLKRAVTEDTEVWWQLSTNALRSVLFPAAYTDGKRTDGLYYYEFPGYKRQLGSSLWLKGLSVAQIKQFHIECAAAVHSGPYSPHILTPLIAGE
jgi:hypothetical protein